MLVSFAGGLDEPLLENLGEENVSHSDLNFETGRDFWSCDVRTPFFSPQLQLLKMFVSFQNVFTDLQQELKPTF